MSSARTRSVPWLLCLLLAVQSLWPVPSIEASLSWLLSPARLIAEFAAPLRWLKPEPALAAQREQLGRLRVERLTELDRALRASAYPGSVIVESSTRRVHAEVVGREASQRDRIRLRVDDPEGLILGLPIVYGDSFVGVVSGVPGNSRTANGRPLASDELVCDLITGKNSRIVARLLPAQGGSESRMVVGGLAAGAGELLLDVHSPTWLEPEGGLVVVDESPEYGEGLTGLANGFFLGDLGPHELGRGSNSEPVWCVRPRLDYSSGLHQVLILAPGREHPSRELPAVDPLETGSWRRTHLLLEHDPSPFRDGAEIPLGSLAGIWPGTALARGRDLIGRVVRVGPFSASVRLLGDPGSRVTAIAMLRTARGERPHVLGQLTARGKRADGAWIFEWPATVPLPAELGACPAEVWTGTGEPGVPLGLFLGETELPAGPGPHWLAISRADEPGVEGPLRVRLPDRAVLEGLEGGGT